MFNYYTLISTYPLLYIVSIKIIIKPITIYNILLRTAIQSCKIHIIFITNRKEVLYMFSKDDLIEISNSLFFLFLSLNSKMINRNIMVKGLSVPPSHMKVIFYLVNNGPSSVSKIANDLVISKPNMTPIIDNLITEGYAVRYDDPNDRRIIIIKTTEKAHDFLRQKRQETVEYLSDKLSTLSNEDIENLRSTLPTLSKIIGKIK